MGSRGRFGFGQRGQRGRRPQNIIRQFEHHFLNAFRASPVVFWRSMRLSGEALADNCGEFHCCHVNAASPKGKKPGRYCHCELATFGLSSIWKIVARE